MMDKKECAISHKEEKANIGFLSKEKAEEIFNTESIYLNDGNVIPCYRVAEMFGEWIKEFIWNSRRGVDFNAMGNGSERPIIFFLNKSGFMKVITEHNYLLMADEIKEKGISGGLKS